MTAYYQCRECGVLSELPVSGGEIQTFPCTVCMELTTHTRKWTAPHIGRVKGAGGSPAR